MTTKLQTIRPDAIPALTGLRFIAALLVLISHAMPKIVPVPDPTTNGYVFFHSFAGIGMPLFFVLSGFVIQYNYASQIRDQGLPGVYNFLVTRFARLYPLFFVCVAFDLTIKWSYQQLPAQTMSALPYYLTLTHSWFYTLLDGHSLVFLFGWMPQVSWSISTEWFFYLAFPFICLGLLQLKSLQSKIILLILVALAGAALVITVGTHTIQLNTIAVAHFGEAANYIGPTKSESLLNWFLGYSPYPRIFEFMLGCVIADIHLSMSRNAPSSFEQNLGMYALLFALAATLCVHSITYLPLFQHVNWFPLLKLMQHSMGYGIPLAAVIFCCARYSNVITRTLSAKYMVLCGEVSYSIYMLHMLIIGAFRWEAATATSWQIGIANSLRMIVVIAATIGLSLITYTLIEMPAKKWLTRRLTYRPKTVATAPVHS
ncbi:MAG: acyltransferase [Parvibaculum sp.]|nr:acyltransferase [Parvibaculum sp.]